MRFPRVGLVVTSVALWLMWAHQSPVQATNHDVFINELIAGVNGDSKVQFVEMVMRFFGQNCWGPQVSLATPGADDNDDDCFFGTVETRSRAMLVFFDAQDREIGRFKFPENPPPGTNQKVLIATREFAALPGAPVPDFIMPPLMSPVNGKVCFQGNPESPFRFDVQLCVSYGAFMGNTQFAGPPAPALSTVNAQSLRRPPGASANLNAQFVLGTPTPVNSASQSFSFPAVSQVQQGETLFNQETFMGNGRTCGQCHVMTINGGLTPGNIQTRFAGLTNTFDSLFIGETADTGFDFNLNTLVISARPTHQSGTDFQNTSGGDLQGVITTAGGGRGKVLARVGPTTYRIYGGLSPALNGVVTDAFGNRATVVSVTAGDLDALEDPLRMRTSSFPSFPQGRSLILENIDGFSSPPVFRKSPHVLNLAQSGPFGFNGDVPDLRTFVTNAVQQHLPRTLVRSSASTAGSNPDFRLPTAAERAAMEAFMLAQEFPAGSDPDKFNLDRFVTTAAERRGRDAFFGSAKCSQCHGGTVLAQTTVDILGKGIDVNAAFNTGVMNQPINTALIDNLPCESAAAGACQSREFSTPQLFNVKSVGPWFHDGSAPTLRAAVEFYDSPAFNNSPAGIAIGGIRIDANVEDDITAFLEGLSEPSSTTISSFANRTIDEDGIPEPISFTISTPDAALSAVSSNTTLLPNENIVFGGSGAARTVALTPAANQFGSVTITISVTDGEEMVSRSFTLTVNPVNDVPTISAVADQIVAAGLAAHGPLTVTIGDVETAPAALSLSASSSNQTVIPNAAVILGGSGSSRTVTLAIPPGASGSTVITLSVSDGSAVSTRAFGVTISAPPPPPPPPPPAPPSPPPSPGPGPNPAPTPVPLPVLPPGAPSGLTALVRDAVIDLQWAASPLSDEAAADPPLGYRIEVGTGSGLSNAATFTTGVTTTFTVGGLLPGTYFVRVRAFNDGGTSNPSNEVVATIVDRSGAPRSLRALVTGRAVQLSWQPPEGAAAVLGYQVEAGTSPGGADVAIVMVPGLSLSIDGVPDGAYFVRVRALAPAGVGPASEEATVAIGAARVPCAGPPGAPRNVIGNVTGTVVQVSWLAPASGVQPASYVILVGAASGQSNLASIPIDGSIMSVTSPAPDGTYFVRILAVNACGSSAESNEITITVGDALATPMPGAPMNLTAQVVGTQVTLNWNPPASGRVVERYIIDVTDLAGNPIVTVDTGNAATTLGHSGVPPGVYVVRVRAANGAGVGPPSASVTVLIQ